MKIIFLPVFRLPVDSILSVKFNPFFTQTQNMLSEQNRNQQIKIKKNKTASRTLI